MRFPFVKWCGLWQTTTDSKTKEGHDDEGRFYVWRDGRNGSGAGYDGRGNGGDASRDDDEGWQEDHAKSKKMYSVGLR